MISVWSLGTSSKPTSWACLTISCPVVTESGPKVLEYNVRGGDPETQTLLPLLSDDTDLAEIMVACADGHLDSATIKIKPDFSATVVACAPGYPGSYPKNIPIHLDKHRPSDTIIFHAGTTFQHGKLTSTGGRVIAATGTAATLEDAVAKAYKGINIIHFTGMVWQRASQRCKDMLTQS